MLVSGRVYTTYILPYGCHHHHILSQTAPPVSISASIPSEATRDLVRGGETASVPELAMLFGGWICAVKLFVVYYCCLFVVGALLVCCL